MSVLKKLLNFLRLSPADRFLLIKSCILLGLIGLGVFLLPLKPILTQIDRLKPRKGLQNGREAIPAARISWAVSKAGRFIPWTKCLAEALTVKALLAREGIASQLRIGVDKCGENQIKAHAWVESQGEVVIGNMPDLSRFKLLSSAENNRT